MKNRLRLYGSTSSNQFPDTANGFQIPPDEHRDCNHVIFQYMKRVKLFLGIYVLFIKENTKEIFKKIDSRFSILLHFLKTNVSLKTPPEHPLLQKISKELENEVLKSPLYVCCYILST